MAYNVVVCVKPVPDPKYYDKVTIDPVKKTITRTGIPTLVNPVDKSAIELALQLKEHYGGSVAVVSMAPPNADEILREVFAAHIADLATLAMSPMADFVEPESLHRTALARFCDFLLAATGGPIRSAIGSYLKVMPPTAAARLLQRMGPFLGLAPAVRFRAEGAIAARRGGGVRAAIGRDLQHNDERYTNTQMWLNHEFLTLPPQDKQAVIEECRDIIGKVDGLEPPVLVAMIQAHLARDDEVGRQQLNQMVFRRMTQTGEIPRLFVDKA
ncbi:MAG: hypothetical protein LBS00_03500 [Synergistaceae bacterium]|jgi:hypothetical protein|nr:hypothetical protein [Synergistaceae bacterium]